MPSTAGPNRDKQRLKQALRREEKEIAELEKQFAASGSPMRAFVGRRGWSHCSVVMVYLVDEQRAELGCKIWHGDHKQRAHDAVVKLNAIVKGQLCAPKTL